jgi:hypothetical protein
MHARIKNGQVVEYPIVNLRQRLSGASLPEDLSNDAALPDGYVYVSSSAPPFYNSLTQKLSQAQPVKVGSGWVCSWLIEPLSAQEVSTRLDSMSSDVRQTRNEMLTACDWTQVADAPVNKAAWAAYRQALRDVTSQPGFPFNVSWPQEPTA